MYYLLLNKATKELINILFAMFLNQGIDSRGIVTR